jgi:hypothetical protein
MATAVVRDKFISYQDLEHKLAKVSSEDFSIYLTEIEDLRAKVEDLRAKLMKDCAADIKCLERNDQLYKSTMTKYVESRSNFLKKMSTYFSNQLDQMKQNL